MASKLSSGNGSLDVEFTGIIQCENRAELLNELIKFILYQRNQIPMYFNQMKDFLKQQLKLDSSSHRTAQVKLVREEQTLVHSLETLFQSVHDVMTSGETVKQVLIILGSNIVAPRESYLLTFPTEFYEGSSLSRQSCISRLFQVLYEQDFLGSVKPLKACTTLHVLFLMPRDSQFQHFNIVPKLSFRVPVIGSRFDVNIVYQPGSVTLGSSRLDLVGDELNISGIKPLDDSLNAGCTTSSNAASCSTLTVAVESAVTSTSTNSDSDLVWFQLPTCVHGFREKFTENL